MGIESVTLIQTSFSFTAEKRPFALFLYTVQAHIQTCSNVCGFKIQILNSIRLQIRYNIPQNIRRIGASLPHKNDTPHLCEVKMHE